MARATAQSKRTQALLEQTPSRGALGSARDSILRPIHAETYTRPRIENIGWTTTETYYLLNPTATQEQRLAFAGLLVYHGTSSSTTHSEWRTFVLTVILFFLHDLIKENFTTDQVYVAIPVDIDDAKAQEIKDIMMALDSTTDRTEISIGQAALAAVLPKLEKLPKIDSVNLKKGLSKDLYADTGMELTFGWASLVTFLAGKTVNPENRASITVKRPSAIIRKLQVEETVSFLNGNLRLSDNAHGRIHTAWITLDHARFHFFRSIIPHMKRFSHNRNYGTYFLTVRLLAYSGMQLVILIDKYLSAVTIAETLPLFAPSLDNYRASLGQLALMAADERPFSKLMYGDTSSLFHRNLLEPLMVIAIAYDAQHNPTLSQYNLPGSAVAIKAQYERQLANETDRIVAENEKAAEEANMEDAS